MSNLLVLMPILLLGACSSFHTVSTTELESRNLVGDWHSLSGSRLSIYCSGAISYEINGYSSIIGDTKSSCSACSVNQIEADQMILGPLITTKFKVERWPFQEGDLVKMVAEDNTWVKASTKQCR